MQEKDVLNAKINKYSDREELWTKLFYVSLVFLFLIIVLGLFVDTVYKYYLEIGAAIFMVFSRIVLQIYQYLYETKLVKLAKENNTLDTLNGFKSNNDISNKNMTINYVLEGKYKNRKIRGGSTLDIDVDLVPLNKRYISSHTIIDETNKDQYSFWKGALGVALLGDIGVIAGMGGKNKKNTLSQSSGKTERSL